MASGSGWNLWVLLAGGGCGWKLWVWLVGCGCKEVYRFPHIYIRITYPYSSCICSFFCSIPTFVLFFYIFRSCSGTFW